MFDDRLTVETPTCCAGCWEPVLDARTCICCRGSVCTGCAEYDRDGDAYCPECAGLMRAFVAEPELDLEHAVP